MISINSILKTRRGGALDANWVIGTQLGRIFISNDNINWFEKTSPFGGTDINGLAYGNGIWVAVGSSGKIATSTTGYSWSLRSNPFGSTKINAVTFDNNIFVAVGNSAKIATSLDGISWIDRTDLTATTSNLYAVAYGNGTWLATGGTYGGTYDESAVIIASTTNATTWVKRPRTGYSGITKFINAVRYGNSMWLIDGANFCEFMTSTDTYTFTERHVVTPPFINTIHYISYFNNMFHLGGYLHYTTDDARSYYSTDGLIFNSHFNYFPVIGSWPKNIGYRDGTWRLISYANTGVGVSSISSDGINWSYDPIAIINTNMYAIATKP